MATTSLNISREMNILCAGVRTFATVHNAYRECSDEIQAIIDDMLVIVSDADASDEEQSHALDVIVEALFPALTADIIATDRANLRSEEAEAAKAELNDEKAAFADRLGALMRAKGVTQEELAKRVGVRQPAISMLLNRQHRPQQRTVRKMAEALGVETSELWPGTGK